MVEDTKNTEAPVVLASVAATLTPVIAPVAPSAPIVLSQAPPMVLSDAKPVVDKAASVVPSTFEAMK